MKSSVKWLAAVLALSAAPVVSVADMHGDQPAKKQHPPAALINDALKAGPKSITDQAAVMTMDGKTLRAGQNGWVCYPGPNVNGLNSMCLDKVWQKWAAAWMGKTAFQTTEVGVAYMLAGDEGASNTEPWATGPTATNQWVVEGPHLMVLVPDPATLAGIPTDPNNGGPYVMWAGTPYAHIMIPVGKRMPMKNKAMPGKKMMEKPAAGMR